MSSNLVCTAGTGHRSSCGTRCEGCRFLKADRRQRVHRMDWSLTDRRTMSNWLPAAYRLAGAELAVAGAAGAAVVAGSGSDQRTFSTPFVWSIIFLLMSFNILDCILTARALSMGFEEANPVMAGLFNASLPLGMLAKTLVVSTGALTLWKFREMGFAVRGMMVVTAAYGAVVIYHLAFQLSL